MQPCPTWRSGSRPTCSSPQPSRLREFLTGRRSSSTRRATLEAPPSLAKQPVSRVTARNASWLAGRRRAEAALPPVRRALFLYEKVRLKWRNWRQAGAPRRVLRWIKRGVPCYWKNGPPRRSGAVHTRSSYTLLQGHPRNESATKRPVNDWASQMTGRQVSRRATRASKDHRSGWVTDLSSAPPPPYVL